MEPNLVGIQFHIIKSPKGKIMATDTNNYSGNVSDLGSSGNTSLAKKMTSTGQPIAYIGESDKIICTDSGKAEVLVKDDMVIISNQNNGIKVSPNGLKLQGNLSISAEPSDIRIAGHWVLNTQLLTCTPSTLMNPVQTFLSKDPAYARQAYLLISTLTSMA